jgi:hypothetical protein
VIASLSACSCNVRGRGTETSSRQQQAIFTQNAGLFYELECEANGVPRPANVLDSNWVNHGVITDVFISPQDDITGIPLESELWSLTTPEGICLALPRWFTGGPNYNRASLFGVICMGQQSGKACFWDNPRGMYFARNTSHPLALFAGGEALLRNGQGVCSDCHAGENPFVIHPDKEAFKSLLLDPVRKPLLLPRSGWHEPIIPGGWPANPGPTNVLVGRPGSSCEACHKLPDVSRHLPDYCDVILKMATSRATETMPRPFDGEDAADYAARRATFSPHTTALLGFCQGLPQIIETVYVGLPGNGGPLSDDVSILSPPFVDEPIYQCSQAVVVRGVAPGATTRLFRNGNLVATQTAGAHDEVHFNLPSPVVAGETFTAHQTLAGTTSDAISPVTAAIYPNNQLPTPSITTPLYACADQIGVHANERNVFAKVQKDIPGAVINDIPVGGSWIAASPPPTPWVAGDTFKASTFLCGTQSSPAYATAAALPSQLSQGRFWTPAGALAPEMYDGQEYLIIEGMDNGAYATVSHFGSPIGETNADPEGQVLVLHLPTSGLGRNAMKGDQFEAEARFACPGSPTGGTIYSGSVLSCSNLPAPEIVRPRAGENSIIVRKRVPGARIRVYRFTPGVDTYQEIGDGAGPRVYLAPPNVFQENETIRVIQQVGTCTGTQGYSAVTLPGL